MIASGGDHSCALTNSGNVKCWGRGEYGILGNGNTTNSLVPVDVHTSSTDPSPLSDIASIASANLHTCALTNSGEVKCWGFGIYGNLGHGTNSNSTTPVSVCERAKTGGETICPPLSSIAAITVWGNTTCALTDSNTVKCWGIGSNGDLGNGADNNSNIPVDVHTDSGNSDALSGIAAIGGPCALTDDGNVKCWGWGNYGRLGNGGTSHSNTPVDVCQRAKTGAETTCPALADIAAISAGQYHRCALTDSGTLKCWGRGSDGRLGNGATTTTNSIPVNVRTSSGNSDDLSGVEKIALGVEHSCALMNDSSVKCWGEGGEGRLGNGATTDQSSPVDVHTSSDNSDALSDIASVSGGGEHTCALTLDSTVKCWGKGDHGRLGNGATDDSSYPVDVLGGRKWTVVAP